jgi:hypothetical protein
MTIELADREQLIQILGYCPQQYQLRKLANYIMPPGKYLTMRLRQCRIKEMTRVDLSYEQVDELWDILERYCN